MVRKNIFLFLIVCSVILISLSFVSAAAFTARLGGPGQYINRTAYTQINFTINGTGPVSNISNISYVTISFPFQASFIAGSNSTSVSSSSFSNITVAGNRPVLIWNLSSNSIPTTVLTNFSFNASLARITPAAFFRNFTINVTYTNGTTDSTSYTFTVNFAFAGYVKNETGNYTSNVNVSMYQFVEGTNSPPSEILEASTLTDSNGFFSFPSLNGSSSGYKIKMILYTPSPCTRSNDTCNATKIGSSLPNFPAELYYPVTEGSQEFAFMNQPTLNGTTFYLQPAATLRLTAHNGTQLQRFGYEVVDQIVGFPVESNFRDNAATKDIIVPTGRNFTIMFVRAPNFAGGSFGFYDTCNGAFMNDTACPTPPLTNSTHGTLVAGQIITINQSMNITKKYLSGCINISLGANNSAINVTNIIPKLIPWPGFVPPIRAEMGDLNVADTTQLNRTNSSGQVDINGIVFCPAGYVAGYNISVIGSDSGINYLIEFYGKNATNEAGDPGNAYNLGAFQNITVYANASVNFNISLKKLLGSYVASGDINTSKMKINIQNSSGGAISNNMNANVKIKNPTLGTETYMIESMSSGTFYIPILNNSNWAKLMVFASDSPPKEVTLNLTVSENNITLTTMSDGKGVGMKRINSSGHMEMINSTLLNATKPITLRFLRNSNACNVLEPAINCQITAMDAKNFNPLTALVAGKVNMEMKITSTNTTLTFYNFDMFTAKQPPMDSIMDDQAKTGASTTNQIWQFGSFAPVNTYEYVIIAMPYSDTVINEASPINISIPFLYDENWNAVWNLSRGDTSASLTDDFLDYNSTSSGLYRNYLTSTGINCSTSDSNLNVTPCFVNTTSNYIYMKIPHFSGVGPNIAASPPAAASSTTSSSSGGASTLFWVNTQAITQEQFKAGFTKDLFKKYRIQITIDKTNHYVGVVELTATTATINISSTPQQAVFNIGDEKKFDVTSDGYYDISVKLNSITNNKASVTVKSIYEKITTAPATNATTPATPTEPEPSPTEPLVQKPKTNIWLILAVVLIAIAIIAVLYFVLGKKNSRKVHDRIKVFDF